jgi:hypothetical protein
MLLTVEVNEAGELTFVALDMNVCGMMGRQCWPVRLRGRGKCVDGSLWVYNTAIEKEDGRVYDGLYGVSSLSWLNASMVCGWVSGRLSGSVAIGDMS